MGSAEGLLQLPVHMESWRLHFLSRERKFARLNIPMKGRGRPEYRSHADGGLHVPAVTPQPTHRPSVKSSVRRRFWYPKWPMTSGHDAVSSESFPWHHSPQPGCAGRRAVRWGHPRKRNSFYSPTALTLGPLPLLLAIAQFLPITPGRAVPAKPQDAPRASSLLQQPRRWTVSHSASPTSSVPASPSHLGKGGVLEPVPNWVATRSPKRRPALAVLAEGLLPLVSLVTALSTRCWGVGCPRTQKRQYTESEGRAESITVLRGRSGWDSQRSLSNPTLRVERQPLWMTFVSGHMKP